MAQPMNTKKMPRIALAVATALCVAPAPMLASAGGNLAAPLVTQMTLLPGCIVTSADGNEAMRVICSPDTTAPAVSVKKAETEPESEGGNMQVSAPAVTLPGSPDGFYRIVQRAPSGGGYYRMGGRMMPMVLHTSGAAFRVPVIGRLPAVGGGASPSTDDGDLLEVTLSW